MEKGGLHREEPAVPSAEGALGRVGTTGRGSRVLSTLAQPLLALPAAEPPPQHALTSAVTPPCHSVNLRTEIESGP